MQDDQRGKGSDGPPPGRGPVSGTSPSAAVRPGGNSARKRRQRLEIDRLRRQAAAEKRDLSQNEKRLIGGLERQIKLAEALDAEIAKSRPLRAAVEDDAKRRSAEIDAAIGARVRERFAHMSPEEILAMLEKIGGGDP